MPVTNTRDVLPVIDFLALSRDAGIFGWFPGTHSLRRKQVMGVSTPSRPSAISRNPTERAQARAGRRLARLAGGGGAG